MRRREHQSGFGATVILLIVLVVAAVAVTGLVVYQHRKPSSTSNAQTVNTSPSANTQPISNSSTQPAYANWPIYRNTKYGFSYNYPNDWKPSDEATLDPAKNAIRQEFGGGLKLTTNTPNNNTMNFGVLDEPLQTAEAWYDQSYAQSSIKVSKSTHDLKGRQSVQYDFKAPTYESKRYLFAVGSKTYFFESVDEDVNVRSHANYWSDFDNVVYSLRIQG